MVQVSRSTNAYTKDTLDWQSRASLKSIMFLKAWDTFQHSILQHPKGLKFQHCLMTNHLSHFTKEHSPLKTTSNKDWPCVWFSLDSHRIWVLAPGKQSIPKDTPKNPKSKNPMKIKKMAILKILTTPKNKILFSTTTLPNSCHLLLTTQSHSSEAEKLLKLPL